MQWPSYLLSCCLHILFFLLIWFWPASSGYKLPPQAVMISLVEGDMGGNDSPSSILGHVGEPAQGELAPSPPAPKKEVAAPKREEVKESTKDPLPSPKPPKTSPKQKEKKEIVQPKESKPEPKPEPKKDDLKVKQKQKPKEKPKEKEKEKPKEPKQEKPKEKTKETKQAEKSSDEKKAESKKSRQAQEGDAVERALKQARRDASSRLDQGDKGSAVEQALAQAKRDAGGTRGGGGGKGRGPGGGGLADVYRGQVMLAVRPNWGYASTARKNLSCMINVKVDMQGKVQEVKVIQSSGNSQFDQSAVSAIWRTSNNGAFPPPPSQAFTDLDLNFSLNDLLGR